MRSIKNAIFILLMCTILTPTTFASSIEPIISPEYDEVSPCSTYFNYARLSLKKIDTAITVNVKTNAFIPINHIFHDVTIYKNGILYSFMRYEDWNVSDLETDINVPASAGDIIAVEVTHYTSHNGLLEQEYSTNEIMY